MKWTALFLLAGAVHVSAHGYSQQVSLTLKNATMEKAIRALERQSGYSFWYNNELLDRTDKVTLDLRNVSLEDALKKCFENQPLTYAFVGKTIVLSPVALPPQEVKGRVTAEDGTPLAGVSVTIKGTKKGVTTDADGAFSISVNRGEVLVFSSVGYDAKEFRVGADASFKISLVETKKNLGDLVVVGYGKQNRKALTSAVSTVKPEDMNKGAITDVGQLLQGKVPGLNITANGDPNQKAAVVLRGASTINSSQVPFYVVDGIPGVDISLIAPADIASIDILKDAAATAIYGNRASNGVIMVTTKKGRNGDMHVDYGGYVGVEKVSSSLKMMDAGQLRSFLSKNGLAFAPRDDQGANTNWQKAIEKPAAYSQNHYISLSGGNEHSTYIASLNYADKDGILRNSSLQRTIARIAIEHRALNDHLRFNLTVTNANSVAEDIPYRNVVLLQSATYLPVSPVKNADGTYFEDLTNSGYYNPVAMMNNSSQNTKTNELAGLFNTQVKLPWGLTYDLNLAYQNTTILEGEYLNSYYTSTFNNMYDNPDPGFAGHSQQVFGQNGQATRSAIQNYSKLLETFFTWDRHFGDHGVNVVVGYSWQNFVNGDGFQATTANFPVDNVSYNNLALSNPYALSGYEVNFGAANVYDEERLISDFGRLNYNYKEKYLLQGSIRRDGSSVFGTNHRWGYFPAVGAGWRISKEDFMKDQNVFEELKLRGSYGVTGNSTGFSAYTAQFISSSIGSYYYQGTNVSALGPTQTANPNLEWEKTATTDIGLDFAILKGRVSGSLDWYDKKTSNMIFSYSVDPMLAPVGNIVANGGGMSNKGVELAVSAQIVHNRNLTWTSSLNLAHNTNEITSLSSPLFTKVDSILVGDPEGGGQSGSKLAVLQPGHPVGQFFSPQYAGKNSSGVSQYVAHDGTLTTTPLIGTDYHYIGSAQPKLIAGWANTFRYRNFDLNISLRGTFGNKIFNATRADLFRPSTAQYTNILVDAAGESTTDVNSYKYSSRFVENGGYIRFDNATLGYNFPKTGQYIKSLRLYLTGNNLFVITKYKGIDPEVNQGGIAPGIDYNNFYPKTRTFLFGANVSF
ncbi:TonB-dependent receptor [Dinghuibacter silviterrae]|nr:TonB-dependent receptor [Dinghuibacter silviterrae]